MSAIAVDDLSPRRRGWSRSGVAVALLALGGPLAAGCGAAVEPDAGSAEIAAAAGALAANAEIGGARPPGVPSDFMPTPYGYFHPSCVVELRDDEALRSDVIVRGDGSRRPLTACEHPSYDAHGEVRPPQMAPPPYIAQGWIEAAETRAGAIEWLSATWTVPSAPSYAGAQTVYLFPGIVPLATNDTILQPVLGWAAGGYHAWTIASWNCCRNGNALHSPLVTVPSGAEIAGYVQGSTCSVETGVCATWQVQTSVVNGAATTLDTDSYGEALDRTFAGALEVYALDTCSQLPASGSVTFRNLNVRAVGGAQLAPTWSADYWNVTPTCNYGVVKDAATSSVQLRWCRPATCTGLCGQVTDDCGGILSCPPCAAWGGCKGGQKCCTPGATKCALCVSTKTQCP